MTPHTWSCSRNSNFSSLRFRPCAVIHLLIWQPQNILASQVNKKSWIRSCYCIQTSLSSRPFIFGSWLLLQRDICSATWSIFDSQCGIKELKLSSQTLPSFTPFFGENWHRLLLSPQSSLSTNILGTKLPWHWVNPCSFKLCSQGKKTDLEFR